MKFEIGEIAIIMRAAYSAGHARLLSGEEVEITSQRWEHSAGDFGYSVHHPAVKSWHESGDWFVPEWALRKRQPPLNWEKLADPRSLPLTDKMRIAEIA